MPLDLESEILGPLDADRDPNLLSYYIDFGNAQNVLDGRKFIVVGAKGTGKTALKRHIAAERVAEGDQVIKLVDMSRGFDFTKLNAIGMEELTRRTLARIMAAIAGGAFTKEGLPVSKQSRLKEFAERAPFVKTLASAVKLKASFLEISVGDLFKDHAEELESTLDPKVQSAVQSAVNDRRLWVLVDNVDFALTPAGSVKATDLIESILLAADEVNMERFEGRVRVVVFLRAEIYRLLRRSSPELDKVRDEISRLKWSPRELEALLAERIKFSLDSQGPTMDHRDALKLLFAADTDDALNEILEYVFERLMNDPRDLIYLIGNLARHCALDAGSERIGIDHIAAAMMEYGEDKLDGLNAHFKSSYPNIDRVVFNLFQGAPRCYTKAELQRRIDDTVRTDEELRREARWIPTNSRSMIEILYETGVVGYAAKADGPYTYSGRSSSSVGDLLRAPYLAVHPALESYLELT